MVNKNNHDDNIIDKDLYEDLDDEEMYELVQKARKEALKRAQEEKDNPTPKKPFPKWIFWLIAFMMVFNLIALIPQTFSIPAIDFLITSARLSLQEDIKEYKKSVVVVETDDSKGTGFSITKDGFILTNDHVIEGEEKVTVAFPDEGFYEADVVESYPEVDLALLKILTTDEKSFPFLSLAQKASFQTNEKVSFIGNPLRFHGIANEGEILGSLQLESWEKEVIMVRAPVYRGNSGSPVINENGKVIGVIFATLDHQAHGKVGLLVPIDYYRQKGVHQ